MKLAVVMAVHNNKVTLKAAVKSVLNQTFKDFKFIIIDDASTDDSSVILTELALNDKRIKVITNKNQLGLTRSLNKGLNQAKAKYIARMDADDISLPTRFEKQLQFFKTHPDIYFLGTAAYLIDDQEKQLGLKRYPSDHDHIRQLVLRFCPFIHPTWMFRRSIVHQIGDYNQDFLFAQDYELVLRLIPKFKTANLPQPLLKYRVNSPTAISLKNLKTQEWMALKARFFALTLYRYPITESWKLIKPLLSFLIPVKLKTKIYQKFYWK